MDSTRMTLADLAARGPAAARVLQRHRLDFCCGGSRSLGEACAEHGLDPVALLAEIAPCAQADGVRPEALSPVALVDFIIARFHDPLREELARLAGMARKVGRVHGDKPTCPAGLAAHVAEDGGQPHRAHGEGGADPLSDDPRRLRRARAHADHR